MDKARTHKLRNIIGILILVGIIAAVNIISNYYYTRIDLTTDKRYTLGEPSVKMMKGLKDLVYVKVYLSGELPPGFRRLKESTRQTLDEFKAYAGDMIQYEFIDPGAIQDIKERRKLYEQLVSQGLKPVNLQVREEEGSSEKIIFPGAIIYYGDKQIPVRLLQEQGPRDPQQVLHSSITNLEYELVSAIKKLKNSKRPEVAFITGHGELDSMQTASIAGSLGNFYNVTRLNLPKYKVGALSLFDMIVIAKPTKRFSKLDKYKIDQYLMNGGKILWMVESLLAEMDSLGSDGIATTITYPLNLEDQLFTYGIRIDLSLVQDLQSHIIGVMRGSQPDYLPWPYYPLISPGIGHPVVNNLNPILFRFASKIDTVKTTGIKKTILLSSSPYSRMVYHPVRISLDGFGKQPDQRLFNKGPQPVAVLLEGSFPSVFKGRVPPEIAQSGKYGDFREKSTNTAMIVVSDGDVIRNQVSRIRSGDQVMPLGYDRVSNQTFANKDFIMNAIDYLLDESGILKLRSKDFKLRLLEKGKVKEEKTFWQLLNMGGPLVIVILFGVVFNVVRRRRYGV